MAVAMTMGAFIPRFASPRSPTSSLTTTVAAPSAQFLGGNGTSRRRIVAGCRGPSLLRALSGAQGIPHALVRIVAIVGEGCISPLKDASWEEVMLHTANRLKWVDEEFQMLVFTDQSILSKDTNLQNIQKELVSANFLVNVALRNQEAIDWIKVNSEHIPNVICFESSSALEYKLGGFIIPRKSEENVFGKLVDIANSKSKKESLQVVKTVADAWGRHNSDDIRFCLLVIINAYIKPVPMLKNLRAKGFSTLNCMLKNCASEVMDCLLDPNCRKALQCLNACSPTDQVCNYRCIASYESEYLEAFSLCVLEKNNCLELDAEIPSKPFVAPLSAFRGEALSHEVAEDLFVGWLGELDWSWRVVAGQNPAYDQFPCQFQLFYRGKSRNAFWYEPVFQVRTLEGKLVWRRRRYRVVRATVPGTFFFSVLDNGVVSKEFWTIVDVCNDFSWGLFHYSGAARAAGQAYTGAVLVSPDGMYPPDMGGQRLISALEKCSIKEWELFDVDNSSCSSPPLGIPQGSRLHAKIDVKHQKSTYDQRM
ncbi:violaxanthin de-epoxidase, chloroplastic isoform X1 [Dioscorea cayenensis subsp. rotundata]|uniref:Violaxanthin de-epoxidase, chloroplastic isoform X1 n=1 Tax=Dioscorea cayennensis subsp. rotundata TaxID=55577 RepID=A0AB40ARF6_DIOCR|nr:violaxanthin de-epoxidase, chloroplastic isoform X1 [Dioscorea cayenensis subsp. rotundata]